MAEQDSLELVKSCALEQFVLIEFDQPYPDDDGVCLDKFIVNKTEIPYFDERMRWEYCRIELVYAFVKDMHVGEVLSFHADGQCWTLDLHDSFDY